MMNCMKGSAWEFLTGIYPFGNCQHFLYKNQTTPTKVQGKPSQHYYHAIVPEYSACSDTRVNFVMSPIKSYPDPFTEIFNESQVERNLEKMFDVDSLEVSPEEQSISDYDKWKIKEFENSIKFKDNAYHIKLPWHENKIKSVPSNHRVALSVLYRVVNKFEQQKLPYNNMEIFHQQECEGIIERFEVVLEDFTKHTWIPHRPVFKTDTTKTRPVFNYTLKANGKYSLNEAAYLGINLMGDILELLLLFRINKHVTLADICKAFLMIKLRSLEDHNGFCFFMKEGNKLVCFRYPTIIFGFNASPFILNLIIKNHANKFPADNCTHVLKKKISM